MMCDLPRQYVLQKNHGYTYKLHYMFLSGEDRIIYEALFRAIDRSEPSLRFSKGLETSVVWRIFLLLLADNPTLFWIEKHLTYMSSENYLEVSFKYMFPKNEVDSYKKLMTAEVEKIRNVCGPLCKDDYTLALAVHDVLSRNITYVDDGNPSRFTMLGPLLHKKGVCEGISFAYSYILGVFGVNCSTVYGQVNGSPTGHAWNMVFLGGKGYHVDVTHDLKDSSGYVSHAHFCCTDDDLKGVRTWDSPIICNSIDYNYFIREGSSFDSLAELEKYVKTRLKKGDKCVEFRVTNQQRSIVEARIKKIVGSVSSACSYSLSGSGSQYYISMGARLPRLLF